MTTDEQARHPLGQDMLKRLAVHARGPFLKHNWPKNAISLLAAEVLDLRERLVRLEQAGNTKEP